MPRIDSTFLESNFENYKIEPSAWVSDTNFYHIGTTVDNKQMILVSPRTYDKLTNSLQYSYEDVEMEMP